MAMMTILLLMCCSDVQWKSTWHEGWPSDVHWCSHRSFVTQQLCCIVVQIQLTITVWFHHCFKCMKLKDLLMMVDGTDVVKSAMTCCCICVINQWARCSESPANVHVYDSSLWPPYQIGQAIIFLPCRFFLSSSSVCLFFPRLISAVADWMSTILLHMVWP